MVRTDDERVVPGVHPVRELLRAGGPIAAVHLAAGRGASVEIDEIRELAAAADVAVHVVGRHELDRLADGVTHQGVVAVGPPYRYRDVDELLGADGRPALLVALDEVTDPHNLGSIARTAEAVGADGLIVPGRRTVGVTPAAEKAAAGALAHLPVARMTNLVRTLGELGDRRIWSIGLDADAETAVPDCELFTEPLVLVVGAEGRGLSRLTRERCDLLVSLPMRGRVASLNASVAAAVTLYEIRRRRDVG